MFEGVELMNSTPAVHWARRIGAKLCRLQQQPDSVDRFMRILAILEMSVENCGDGHFEGGGIWRGHRKLSWHQLQGWWAMKHWPHSSSEKLSDK